MRAVRQAATAGKPTNLATSDALPTALVLNRADWLYAWISPSRRRWPASTMLAVCFGPLRSSDAQSANLKARTVPPWPRALRHSRPCHPSPRNARAKRESHSGAGTTQHLRICAVRRPLRAHSPRPGRGASWATSPSSPAPLSETSTVGIPAIRGSPCFLGSNVGTADADSPHWHYTPHRAFPSGLRDSKKAVAEVLRTRLGPATMSRHRGARAVPDRLYGKRRPHWQWTIPPALPAPGRPKQGW